MKYFFLFLIALNNSSLYAQALFNGKENYFQHKVAMKNAMLNNDINTSSAKKFSRVDWMYNDRLYPSGDLKEYQQEITSHLLSGNIQSDTLINPVWNQIGNGQYYSPLVERISGNGRVSFIKFHPVNLNRIYAGSPGGCVWVSENNGEDWEALQSIPTCRGFSDMTFDTISNTIYLLTGDYDGKASPFHGIYKSIDDGLSWDYYEGPDIYFGEKISAHPEVANLLFLTADEAFYYSEDAGISWQKNERLSDVQDFVLHPSDYNKIYLFANDSLFISGDMGQNFEYLNKLNNVESNRTKLATIASGDSTLIYIATSPIFHDSLMSGTFKSSDEGTTFELVPNSGSLNVVQSSYNMMFGVYPNHEDRIITGWVEMYWNDPVTYQWTKSYDVDPSIHVDFHCLAFDPKDLDCVLVGNDGGIYRSCDFGMSWDNITGEMQLGQIYHFNNTNVCEDLMIIGTQDNGTSIYHEEIWKKISSGDGISCGFSANSNDTVFWTSQFSSIARLDSLNAVLNSGHFDFAESSVSPTSSLGYGFKNILEISIEQGLLFYKDFKTLYRSLNSGDDWQIVSVADFSIYDLCLSLTNPDLIAYSNLEIINDDTLYLQNLMLQYSINKGTDWTAKYIDHPSLDTISNYEKPIPSAVAFNNQDFSKLWVAVNKLGFHKVFYSDNYGDTWIDYSEGLPEVFLNDIIYQPYSNDALYIATDAGIYFRNDSLDQWHCYSNTIPPTIFTELRISNVSEKLRGSTFGYGLWETELFDIQETPPFANMSCTPISICQNDELLLTHNSSYNIDSVEWHIEGGIPEYSIENEVLVNYPNTGNFDVTLIVKNGNGNDTIHQSNYVTVYDNSINIDSTYFNNETYQLSIPENIDSVLWNTGETSSSIFVSSTGWYSFVGINENNCIVSDSILIDLISHTPELSSNSSCYIFPNPTTQYVNINCEILNDNLNLEIVNILGQILQRKRIERSNNVINLNKGIYVVKIFDDNNNIVAIEKINVSR